MKRLKAGPLDLVLDAGSLRHIRLGDREILRRIYVGVRDAQWATIPIELSDVTIEARSDSFAVDFVADHVRGPIHFRWKGGLRGEPDGSLRFKMDGEVVTTFKRNRIGICVLHPIDECAGRPCRVESTGGSATEGSFPKLISPHQPFLDIRAIAHEGVEVRFEGEVFEMEDQRNWGDASYKTYCTPQTLPRPVEVTAGTRITQTVTLRLAPPPARQAARAVSSPTFEIDTTRAFPMPQLGFALPSDRERLRAVAASYLRVDVAPFRGGFEADLARAAEDAKALGIPLEIAVSVGDAPDQELRRLAEALAPLRPRVLHYLLLPLSGPVTPAETLQSARAILTEPAAPFASGSSIHFTEVNRNRAVVEGADIVAFPSNPQVHLEDELTIVENLACLRWIADTARSFAGARPLALSPVRLRTANPAFAAAWLACHYGHAARSGFHRVTYSGHHELPADLAAFSGGEVLASNSSQPLVVDGVVLRKGSRQRILLANLTGQPQVVRLAHDGTTRPLAPYELVRV